VETFAGSNADFQESSVGASATAPVIPVGAVPVWAATPKDGMIENTMTTLSTAANKRLVKEIFFIQ
jgi:hypothetical protein